MTRVLTRSIRPYTTSVVILALAATVALAAEDRSKTIPVSLQTRNEAGDARREQATINPAKTAVVVVDMWDRHWCVTHASRTAGMVPRMNRTLEAARKLGMQVVFAPSDAADFYRDTPQRQAMLAVPHADVPKSVAFDPPAPPGPTDHCECGPDEPCKVKQKVWTRQNPDLVIAAADLIGDGNRADELLSLCASRGIDTLLYMGAASNICVQYRAVGIRNMKRHGLRAIVVADLVAAITSNGLDAEGKKDLNRTPAGGTAIVQRHLEQYVAPTIESRQLLDAAGLAPQADAEGHRRPRIVFVSAEKEYDSARTMPAFAAKYLGNDFQMTFLKATADEGTGRDDIPGLEAADDADLLVLCMRRRSLPAAQMDHLERPIRAGKPLVALRVSASPFQTRKDPMPGYVVWDRFDQEVLGCNYQLYNAKARATGCDVWQLPAAAGHSILQGVEARFHSPSWIYRQRPLDSRVTVLLEGRWSEEDPVEPVAWTTTYQGGRVFYTTLGHPEDFQIESFNHLLANGVRWALGG